MSTAKDASKVVKKTPSDWVGYRPRGGRCLPALQAPRSRRLSPTSPPLSKPV